MTNWNRIGIDECARGSLAGPMVFATLAHVDENHLWKLGARDSKVTTEPYRAEFFDQMRKEREQDRCWWTTNLVRPNELNQSGYTKMIRATVSAVVMRFPGIGDSAGTVLMDGSPFDLDLGPQYNVEFIPKGDQVEPLIAAASLIAKRAHDRIMEHMHAQYPEWGYDSHKGYYTDKHLEVLYELGPTNQHRIKPCITAIKTYSKKKHIKEPEWLERLVSDRSR